MADGIVHFEIHVRAGEVEKTKKFYEDVFGWKFVDAGMGGDMKYWLIRTGRNAGQDGGQVGIDGGLVETSETTAPEDAAPNAFVCSVQIADIDATLEKVKAAGGKVITDKMPIPGVGTWCKLHDPSGNEVAVLQP